MAAKPKKNRKANGTSFALGNPGGPGRRPGVPNKTTGLLKEAILIAAANCGDFLAQQRIEYALKEHEELLEANGGLVGFLEHVALHETKSFMPLLGKVLPLVVTGSIDHTHRDAVQQRADKFTEAMQSLADRAQGGQRPN